MRIRSVSVIGTSLVSTDHGVCRIVREPVQGGPVGARQPPVRSKRRGGVAEEIRLIKRYDCGDYCGYATQTRLAIFNKTQTTSFNPSVRAWFREVVLFLYV